MCSVHICSSMSRLIFVAGKNRLYPWLWILAFTPGVANLNMTVRQSGPGVAGIVAVD
jgi:hypothetical protein